MSGRALRVGWSVGGALILLSGCSLGTHSDATATASPSVASAPPPVGSVEHPRPVECVDGTPYRNGTPVPPRRPTNPAGSPTSASAAPPPTPTAHPPTRSTHYAPTPSTSRGTSHGTSTPSADLDVTVGPLTWQGLRGLADGDQRDQGVPNSGGWHYRIQSLVSPGAVVTVTVGTQQRARAGLEFGGEYGSTPTPAVTFHACPGSPTSFRGSFFVAGDGRACVPLDVRVGDAPARHVVISFFSGRCPA
ncbi:hypothetical protein SAMN05216223_103409 [Actinacidiphila yanglinensis]|uniref:Uncharacterized protein n=1 Tax=Actinacidiphila yanglinensis TaxID=310779 RepID=A0A1H5XTL1_9ACTN|nr:hypothetical protein [Actinacidiphila yanglinensis]SEG14993.1 hypothetical protein SAMN05216223_103409 [Actinacidiphila yanglinensis]